MLRIKNLASTMGTSDSIRAHEAAFHRKDIYI